MNESKPPQPPPPRTAKATFLASPHRKEFEAIATSEAFNIALDYAIMHIIEQQPSHQFTVEKGWDSYSRILGARALAQELRTFFVPDQTPRPPKFPNIKPI